MDQLLTPQNTREIVTNVDTSLYSMFINNSNIAVVAKQINRTFAETRVLMGEWAKNFHLLETQTEYDSQSLDFTNYRFINYYNAFSVENKTTIQHLNSNGNIIRKEFITAQDFDGMVLPKNKTENYIDFNKFAKQTKRRNNATMQQYSSHRHYDRDGDGLRSTERGTLLRGYSAHQ